MYFYADGYSNLAKSGTLVASSASPYFPVSNINGSALACDVWRSAASGGIGTTETLTIPLGGSFKSTDYGYGNGLDLLIDSWNAFGSALPFGNSTPQIFTVTATLTGPGTVTTVTAAGGGYIRGPLRVNLPLDPSTGTTAVVLTFTRTVLNAFIEVGKILVGIPYDSGAPGTPDNSGYSRAFAELINKDKSVLGQSYSEKRAQFWAGTLNLPLVGESTMIYLRQFLEALGTFTPFWLIVVPISQGNPGGELSFPRYCKLTTPPQEKAVTFGAEQIWAVSLNLEKQL